MRPFDPRLNRYARATRGYLAASGGLGLVAVGLIIGQAALLASAISAVFVAGADLTELRPTLVGLGLIVLARFLVTWLQEVAAHRTAAAVKSELRARLLAHVVRLGPQWLAGERVGDVSTLATRGLDALDTYFARYLPQIIMAALAPAAILAWLLPIDLVAGVTILITVPLIPVFLALVGWTTERLNQRQQSGLARLGHHVLELIAGLPTLKIFGRARAQARAIQELTSQQRALTMRTLRLAFLSSLVLELLATLSVALVAVGIGLRVLSDSIDLRTALVVLILAPEAYLPLRQLGAQYHASAEGLAAAGRVFTILETAPVPAGTRLAVPVPTTITLDGVTVCYPDRGEPALAKVSLCIRPGDRIAITGPSGTGKSTLINVLLGFVRPTGGRVRVGGGGVEVDLADLDPTAWRRGIAYVPQRPYLFAGTVADNIALGADADAAAIGDAATAAGVGHVSLSTVVGENGLGLSAGERQRVALARAFLRNADLVILDEPTASLDADTEAGLIAAVNRLAVGRTLVVVAHRPALLSLVDRVVELAPNPLLVAGPS